ncbi:predicted protein [Postia placenta Mad-698-R]|nr:predicted protein [Postia placenta Mad-698-R]
MFSQLTARLPEVYASLLATISVFAKSGIATISIRHLDLVLLSVWGVYVYRDVWPLATFALSPHDAAEGVILWVQLADLTFAAVFVPLSIPRRYTPVDPKNPSSEPHPEQTASVISRMIFTWLDKTVLKAYRVPHLPIEELPPLADYDQAHNLVQRSFKELDPFQVTKGRHVAWGLAKTFRRDLSIMALMQFLFVVARFSDPIGIRNLLWYMETGGEGAVVKPWVWISWLFLGPAARVTILSYYFFLSEHILVRIEAILTQLVFDHALRMRIMADVPETSTSTGSTTVASTPDTASFAESGSTRTHTNAANSEDDVTLSGTNTAAGETTTTQGKDKSKVSVQQSQKDSSGPSASSEDTQTEGSNVTGKVNNLITTDLDAIAGARDIFQFGKIRGVHAEKMNKTDVRVQAVTEGSCLAVHHPGDGVLNHRDTVAMNAIRMIKLFGWEPRLSKQLGAKREDELTWIKTSKLLELANNNLNHIIPPITMVITYLIYTLIMKEQLTVFEMVSGLLHMTFGGIPRLMRGMFIARTKTELLDEFSEKQTTHALGLGTPPPLISSDTIGFRNASFTWTKAPPSTPGSSKRNFTLCTDGDLTFESGHINLIVGPTGSGKTSLLMALLGEMHYIPAGPDSFVTLPRSGGIAYAAQESWVLNDTIRNNILFGATFDRERYDKVINQCGLTKDLNLFDAGDHTEILAALDVHTAKWIVEKCLQGDLVRGRTVLLVVSDQETVHNAVSSTNYRRRTTSSAAQTGFTLNMAGNSLERIQQYLEIEQEPKSTESGIPPAYWPSSGNLRVEKLSARYSADGPRVLHEISFELKSGERVGVVGRTGSGKSTLTLALLRCVITEGQVYYDGLSTEKINLDALRSHITIIPQVVNFVHFYGRMLSHSHCIQPELLSGTLRQNLDPFEEFDDAALNDALRSAGLFSLQKDMDEGQITLDTQIANGGNNLSFGQKQILALARAIVRQSKLLILDEATSAIDYETDTVIQASLRKELDKGTTVLTVAHRLQTIMDADKIMVLDAGHIVEFGKPSELLRIQNGLLRALVDESGDRENLISMAAGAGMSM